MTKFHATPDGQVPFTAEEEALADAEAVAAVSAQYKNQRQLEYPLIGDQLDALWKGGEAAVAMLAQVQAVKAKYPKL